MRVHAAHPLTHWEGTLFPKEKNNKPPDVTLLPVHGTGVN